jgi:hypothetical protein
MWVSLRRFDYVRAGPVTTNLTWAGSCQPGAKLLRFSNRVYQRLCRRQVGNLDVFKVQPQGAQALVGSGLGTPTKKDVSGT